MGIDHLEPGRQVSKFVNEQISPSFEDVVILLATWNGERYLGEQLNSISRQTYPHWRLVVSDDGSDDRTLEIIERFAAEHPGKVSLLEGSPVHSAKDNFFRLLHAAPPASYYALCDQDDVWVDTKLEVLLSASKLAETRHGESRPGLVFSDLTVVNSELSEIAASFMAQTRAIPEKATLGSLLVENVAPGCSMLFNFQFIELFRVWRGSLAPALMHDWWLALLAYSFGLCTFVDKPLVRYRQHANNTLGSVKRSGLSFMLRKLRTPDNENREKLIQQASLLLEAYEGLLPAASAQTLSAYSSIKGKRKLSRIWTCISNGVLKQTWSRRIYQLIRV